MLYGVITRIAIQISNFRKITKQAKHIKVCTQIIQMYTFAFISLLKGIIILPL